MTQPETSDECAESTTADSGSPSFTEAYVQTLGELLTGLRNGAKFFAFLTFTAVWMTLPGWAALGLADFPLTLWGGVAIMTTTGLWFVVVAIPSLTAAMEVYDIE